MSTQKHSQIVCMLIEAELPTDLYNQPIVQSGQYSGKGELTSTSLNVSFTVRCEEGFFGEGCERLCSFIMGGYLQNK